MTAADGLVAALVKAQAEFPPIAKSQENKHFGSRYADLADVLKAVRPVLAANGLAITQLVSENEHGTILVTKLLHVGGGELTSTMPLAMDGISSQAVGSLLTYLRRYCALAICGVHPDDDDDDGNSSSSEPPARRSSRPAQSGGKPATPKQVDFAHRLLSEVVAPPLVLSYIEEATGRAAQLEELSTAEMSRLIDRLQDDKKAGRTADGDVAEYGPGEEPF